MMMSLWPVGHCNGHFSTVSRQTINECIKGIGRSINHEKNVVAAKHSTHISFKF